MAIDFDKIDRSVDLKAFRPMWRMPRRTAAVISPPSPLASMK